MFSFQVNMTRLLYPLTTLLSLFLRNLNSCYFSLTVFLHAIGFIIKKKKTAVRFSVNRMARCIHIPIFKNIYETLEVKHTLMRTLYMNFHMKHTLGIMLGIVNGTRTICYDDIILQVLPSPCILILISYIAEFAKY